MTKPSLYASNNNKGKLAEYIAVTWLKLTLHKIIRYNYQSRLGQIDIIAKKGKTIIFVEVKLRKKAQHLTDSISYNQQQRIENSANAFFEHNSKFKDCRMRFDAIYICPYKLPQHVKNIF